MPPSLDASIAAPDGETPAALAAMLVDLLDLEEIDVDLYRGKRRPGGVGRVFGGQVVAQALQAAQRSTEAPKIAHSLHAYFMRPGSEDLPIVYRVIRDFDGTSFATRRVVAMQRGQPILTMATSLQLPEEGLHHQDAMPDVPPPDGLASERELAAAVADRMPERLRPLLLRPRPLEFRPLHPRNWLSPEPREPCLQSWFRVAAPIDADPAMHRAILAYASDSGLIGTSMMPHGVGLMTAGMQVASLDHAVWLHEPFRADQWLLLDCDSPWAGHGRGFNRARIFSQNGRLVASVVQEGLIRRRG